MAGKRSPKKSESTGGQSSRLVRHAIVVVLTLAVVAGLVWGIKWLGDEAQRDIASRDRYTVRFVDIECDMPPGADRPTFLSEVRYVSNHPESFQSIDPDQLERLKAAFRAHPWVAKVEEVSAAREGVVRVKLTFRMPELVIRLEGGGRRAVDRDGILLPSGAESAELPELTTPVPQRSIPAGQHWPDDSVKRAVELVQAHHPRKLEKTPQGWRLTMGDGKVAMVER